MMLYYNCTRPLDVLTSKSILKSKTAGGVSLSQQFNIGSHGPFKLAFKDAAWEHQMHQVIYLKPIVKRRLGPVEGYQDQFGKIHTPEERDRLIKVLGPRVIKSDHFMDEEEWWSDHPIMFSLDEISGIYFMTNAPNLYPRITAKARIELKSKFPDLYQEIVIHDSYLKNFKLP